MNTPTDKTKEDKSQASLDGEAKMQSLSDSTFQVVDSPTEAAKMQPLQELANTSPEVKGSAQLQAPTDDFTGQTQAILRQENKTSLPDNIKTGIENISGYSTDDVKVHYGFPGPVRLNANAFAQGTDIDLGPGQEKHLPHELGHEVSQQEGSVKPTLQIKDKGNINDDAG
jgi:hypothetical protein